MKTKIFAKSKKTIYNKTKRHKKIEKSKEYKINKKIKKVLPLVSKAYEQGSFVNEDEKMVYRLAIGLKPNQWLRVEDKTYGSRDYSTNIKIQQAKTCSNIPCNDCMKKEMIRTMTEKHKEIYLANGGVL